MRVILILQPYNHFNNMSRFFQLLVIIAFINQQVPTGCISEYGAYYAGRR